MSIACIAVDWGTSNRRAWALDAGGEVLDQLGTGTVAGRDRPGVGVGEQRDRRVVEGDPGEDIAHLVRGLRHQR